MSLQRPNIESMQGYTPGEQLNDAGVIKLNTNENPYPPAPQVGAALAAIDPAALRRYPPPLADEFRDVAARLNGVDRDNIIPTNGGDELLRLVLTTFVEPSDTVVVAQPSYSLYPVLAEVAGCNLVQVPLQADWNLASDFKAALQTAKLCILVNPHAPSGHLTSVDSLRDLALCFDGILMIDEAYVDFIDPELNYDSMPLIRELDNVVVLRTLSKGYSLAGLRFGYGIGAKSLIEPMLLKTRDSYNTDLIAQRLACAALQAEDYARANWARVRESRATLAARLAALGLKSEPSQSNFILCRVPDNPGAKALYEALKARKILVRYFDQPGLRDRLRISIGTEEENAALATAIATILSAD